MIAELLTSMFAAFFKAFGDTFLSWVKEQQTQKAFQQLGRSEQEAATNEEAAKLEKQFGSVVARPDDTDADIDRLRNGTA